MEINKCGNCIYAESSEGRKKILDCEFFKQLMDLGEECIFKNENKTIKLSETVEMMNSEDYKERFKAEYMQLKIRMLELSTMIADYEDGVLPFTPSYSCRPLKGQYQVMCEYAVILKNRALLENIEIETLGV